MRAANLAGFATSLVILVAPAVAQRVGGTVTIAEPLLNDQYVAGRTIRVNAPIEGDLVAAGQSLIIDADIGGDLIVAGESLELRSRVADDVRAAGRTVTVGGPVSGHIVAAGENVSISAASSIAEWAWLAGSSVTIDGSVGQELRAAAESISVNGRVEGDANLMGQRVEIGSAAVIGGDLIVQSRTDPAIADGATILGEIIREDLPDAESVSGPLRWVGGIAGFVYFSATLITAVLVLGLLFPRFTRATSDRLSRMPLRAVGAGVLVAIGIPVLTVVAFITGIGLIVGVGLLVVYLLALLIAAVLGVIAVGQIGLRLMSEDPTPPLSRTILALVIAALIVLLVRQIPVIGGLALILLTLFALGAASGELWARYRQSA